MNLTDAIGRRRCGHLVCPQLVPAPCGCKTWGGASPYGVGRRAVGEPKGRVSLCLPAASCGLVAARTEFSPALPDFLLANNNNNNSLKGVNGVEKWLTGLWAVQFYFPLWRHYLNSPFLSLFLISVAHVLREDVFRARGPPAFGQLGMRRCP